MHATQHPFQSGQHVIAAGRDAKREQRRLGIAQRVELATQVSRQFVEGLLQRPTLAIERCYSDRTHFGRQIGEHVNLLVPVASGRFQTDGNPPQLRRAVASRITHFGRFFVHSTGLAEAHVARFSQ